MDTYSVGTAFSSAYSFTDGDGDVTIILILLGPKEVVTLKINLLFFPRK